MTKALFPGHDAIHPQPTNKEVGFGSAARIESLDALRTLMCFGIATYHFAPYFFDKFSLVTLYTRYFSYFTDMFFVFAGLFMAKATYRTWSFSTYREFLITRMARLYPLHVTTLIFYVFIAIAAWLGWIRPANPDRYNLVALIPQITLTQAWGIGPPFAFDYPNWALSAIFACYIAVPALSWISQRGHLVALIIITMLIAAGSIVAFRLSSELTSLQGQSLGVLRALPSVLFGITLGRLNPNRRKRVTAATMLLAAILFSFSWGHPLTGYLRLASVYLIITAVLISDRSGLWTPLRLKVLQRGAKYSFGIYLIHSLVATTFLQTVIPSLTHLDNKQIGHDRPALSIVLIGLALLITWVLAWISLRTIERHGAKLFISLFRLNIHKAKNYNIEQVD